MRLINYLIITESYIYRTGLRFLLEELDSTGKIYFSDDISQIGKSNADFLFIDLHITTRGILEQQIRSVKNDNGTILVGLTTYKKEAGLFSSGLFHFFLDLSGSKSEITRSLNEITRNSLPPGKKNAREEKLSEREKTILRYVALGHTNREIAEKLFISMHTVITHRKNITRKLGIKTVSGLTVYAILNHLIEMNDAG